MCRELTCGWELGNVVAEGTDGSGSGIPVQTGLPHVDGSGGGGTWHLQGNSISANPTRHRFQRTFRPIVDGWIRIHERYDLASTRGIVVAIYSGATELFQIRVQGSTGAVSVYRGSGAGTLLLTSAGTVFPIGSYFTLEAFFRLSDTIGVCNVYINDPGTYTTPVLAFSGDTKPGAETTWNTIGVGVGSDGWADEVAVNSVTLQYDGGTGTTPLAGTTITSGSATAVITSVEGTAASGRLVLQQWNGVAFVDNAAVTSGTFAALINAPHASNLFGLEQNSTAPGEGFVVYLPPTGAGTTTQLTPSAGSNFQCVDEVPPNTTDFVSSSVANQLDTYAKGSLPASATKVTTASVYVYAAKDGATINNFRPVLRLAGTNYFGVQTALAASYAGTNEIFNVNPATGVPFVPSDLNGSAAEPGFQVRT